MSPLSVGRAAYGLLGFLLLATGWGALGLLVAPWLRDRVAGQLLRGGAISLGDLTPVPDTVRVASIVIAALLVAGGVIVARWLRANGGPGALTDHHLRHPGHLGLVMLGGSLVLAVALLSYGELTVADAKSHVARGWFWEGSLRSGSLPLWTDLWYGGYPIGHHYPPLAHILQAILGLLGLSPHLAAKVMVWALRGIGAVGFALLCRSAHGCPRAGLMGGIIYALAPVTHAALVWHGHLPATVVIALFPWLLLGVEGLVTGRSSLRTGAALAVAVWGLVLAHTGAAVVALAFALVYGLVRGLPTLRQGRMTTSAVQGLVVGVIGGLLLAGAFIVTLTEANVFTRQALAVGGGLRGSTIAEVVPMLRWSPRADGYVGLSVVALAVIGWLRALRASARTDGGTQADQAGPPIGAIALLVLALVPWFLTAPGRPGYELLSVGMMLLASGSVVARPPGGPRSRVLDTFYLVALVLVLVDLAPLNLITSYRRDRAAKERSYTALAERQGGGRFLELPLRPDGTPRPSIWHYHPTRPLPSVAGPFIQGAPPAYKHQMAMIDTVARSLERTGRLRPELIDYLAFHNVRHLLFSSPSMFHPPQVEPTEGIRVDESIPALEIERASPAAVIRMPSPPGPSVSLGVPRPSGLEPSESRALARGALVWLRTVQPQPIAGATLDIQAGRVVVGIPDVGACTVRIARNDAPFTCVRVDGQVNPWRSGPLGGIVIDVTEGPHTIEVDSVESSLRRSLRYGQWALAVALMVVAIGPGRRRSSP